MKNFNGADTALVQSGAADGTFDSNGHSSKKAAYSSPVLLAYGQVKTLTQGSSGSKADTGALRTRT